MIEDALRMLAFIVAVPTFTIGAIAVYAAYATWRDERRMKRWRAAQDILDGRAR